jgi:hypothetical protein
VGTKVSTLSKLAVTLVARERAFTGVATSMSLKVAQLRKGELAAGEVTRLCMSVQFVCQNQVQTYIWLLTTVCSAVDVEVSLLGEALLTARAVAVISLPLCLVVHGSRGSMAFQACIGNRRHSRSEWLVSSVRLHLCLALNSLHQLIHLSLKVDLVATIQGCV